MDAKYLKKLDDRIGRADGDRKTRLKEKRKDYLSKENQYRRTRKNFLRYGQFLADVSVAESPEEITSAFQNVAVPKGSSLQKRIRRSSVDLNAYFGGTLSHEITRDSSGLNSNDPINSYGLFVPVGLSFSRQLDEESGFSFSVFLPLIDLGALTAYRTDANDKNLEVLPDFTFANVFSPGAHLLLNFPKSPFFVGAGLQLGPNVREFTDGSTKNVKGLRYMMTFGIDVPLLTFTRKD